MITGVNGAYTPPAFFRNQMNNQLKQKIRNRMDVVLTVNGYPDITSEHILALLPRLWESVKDIIPEDSGFDYEMFMLVAQQEYTKSKLQGY